MQIAPWRDRASCRGMDDEMFFERRGPATEAQSICRTCPVRNDCLMHALTMPEQFGIWAGTTPGIRRSLLRGRRRSTCPACRGLAFDIDGGTAQACHSCALTWPLREARAAALVA